MDHTAENTKKTIYQYDVKTPKEIPKPYSSKLLISPLFCAIVVNLTILMIAVAIGFYFGILGSLNSKRLYGDKCKFDSDCEKGLSLRCQNGYCNCTSLTFFNRTLIKCVPKQLNGIPCSSENDCCCDQKCLYDLNRQSNICSCTTDRWWDNSNSYCQKKSYYEETCSTIDQCQLNTNLVCLSNKCSCSDPNLTFWNGTYCDNVQSYLGICRITPGCNPSQGLICNITEQYPYKCTCPPFNYWDSAASLCKAQKTVSVACTSTEECTSDTGLYCNINCRCLDNYFWSTNKCIKRMTYGEYCSITLLCDETSELSCINSYCACTGSRFWNSSYCVLPISSGLNCDNSYSCNSALGLSCDRTTFQCVCASTHYWSQGSCRLKEINGTWCTHSLQCQTQNGLSCVTNRCFCAEFHYWSGTECLLKQTVNTWCTQTYQCQDYNGLVCLNTGGKRACECQYPRYWNGNECVDKLSHGLSCSLDSECNQNLGLACYGKCRCDASRYWTGSICETKKNFGSYCSQNYECKDNLALLCLSGVCSCMPLMYWSNSKCEFKRPENEPCSGSNPACQNYAGLSCTTVTCRCSSTQYWVTNKCQNYVGINQYCDGTTYRCKSGLTCQGSAAGNYICQCGAGTYWTGTSCASVRTYGNTCDRWRVPCDHSRKLKCLSSGEGSSCLSPGYTGTRCNCIDTDYWSGTTCVSKLLDHVITNVTCQCRQDLGLSSLSYQSTYTCYNNYFPNNTCACQNTQYWGGEKCVDKKTQNLYCTTDCQCKENLGLKCWPYTNGYSCYVDFGDGKRCLCETVTQWWTGTTCANKYWYSNDCGSTCQCREDKGLGCQSFGDYNRHSCASSYTGTKCYCKLSTDFWSGTTNDCITKYLNLVSCLTHCECREDLGLACRLYVDFYGCNTNFAGTQCTCVNSAFWTGSTCVARYGHRATCTNSCQCQMNLGLRCETQNNNCYSYTGSQCVCRWWQYWNGASCIDKGTWNSLCSINCQCRTDLGYTCYTWNATPRCYN